MQIPLIVCFTTMSSFLFSWYWCKCCS